MEVLQSSVQVKESYDVPGRVKVWSCEGVLLASRFALRAGRDGPVCFLHEFNAIQRADIPNRSIALPSGERDVCCSPGSPLTPTLTIRARR